MRDIGVAHDNVERSFRIFARTGLKLSKDGKKFDKFWRIYKFGLPRFILSFLILMYARIGVIPTKVFIVGSGVNSLM